MIDNNNNNKNNNNNNCNQTVAIGGIKSRWPHHSNK